MSFERGVGAASGIRTGLRFVNGGSCHNLLLLHEYVFIIDRQEKRGRTA